MNLEGLLRFLLAAAICAGLAFVATLILKRRHGVLALVGAGLLGQGIGSWFAGLVHGADWPVVVASVHLLWTFVGALLVLFVFRFIPDVTK